MKKKLTCEIGVKEKTFTNEKGEEVHYLQLEIIRGGYTIPVKSIYKNTSIQEFALKQSIWSLGEEYE